VQWISHSAQLLVDETKKNAKKRLPRARNHSGTVG